LDLSPFSSPLPAEAVAAFVQVALAARARGDTLAQAIAASGAEGGFLAAVEERYPVLLTHLRALAERQPRPQTEVPKALADLLDQAWATAESGKADEAEKG
jgi:hypothetical protein